MTSLDSPPRSGATSASSRLSALLLGSAGRFLAVGLTSTVVELGLLYLLFRVAGMQLEVATSIAWCAGFATNFLLNRIWAFESNSPVGSQTVRYGVMAAGNWLGTVLLVDGLTWLGVYFLLSRAIALAVLLVPNYLGYKHWVFRKA